jgi:DNA-binding IclR family transcriptional regulator
MEERKYVNTSLEKAFTILELFDRENEKLGLTEIAKRLNTRPGTLYPVLYTLEKHGYLKRNDNKKYSLGLKFLEKGNLILEQLDIRDQAKPHLRELADRCGANAHLAVLYDWKVMYLHREEGYPSVIIKEIVGRRVPAYCTALGKVLLAYLNDEELADFFAKEKLKPLTPNTITDPERLKEELSKVRKRGYAIDNEEFHEGNMCIAAPVRNYQGKVVGSVSISLPKSKFSSEYDYIKEVRDAATNISKDLGFSEENNRKKQHYGKGR